jgi:hypothetical protein
MTQGSFARFSSCWPNNALKNLPFPFKTASFVREDSVEHLLALLAPAARFHTTEREPIDRVSQGVAQAARPIIRRALRRAVIRPAFHATGALAALIHVRTRVEEPKMAVHVVAAASEHRMFTVDHSCIQSLGE